MKWESSSEEPTRTPSTEISVTRAEVCLTRHDSVTERDALTTASGPVLIRIRDVAPLDTHKNGIVIPVGTLQIAGPILVRNTGLKTCMLWTRHTGLGRGLGRRSGAAFALLAAAILTCAISYHVFSPRPSATTADLQRAPGTPPVFVERLRTGNDDKSGPSVVPATAEQARSRELVAARINLMPQRDGLTTNPHTVPASFTIQAPNTAAAEVPSVPVPELPPQLLANLTVEHPDAGHAANVRQTELADQAAWRSVSPKDENALKMYLQAFPAGDHTAQAQHLLSELAAVRSRDADAVLAALAKYSEAWSKKAVADITALRPSLEQRAVKRELASVRSIAMHIRPVSSPKIEGDRAAVECIHEVEETFSDGVEKTKPGVRMTYDLVRSGGNWLIQDSR